MDSVAAIQIFLGSTLLQARNLASAISTLAGKQPRLVFGGSIFSAPPAPAEVQVSADGPDTLSFHNTDEVPTAILQAAAGAAEVAPVETRSAQQRSDAGHSVPAAQVLCEAAPISREIAAGTIFRGRYVLEAQIGRGGNSTVFRVQDLNRVSAGEGDGQVAIKVLRPELRGNASALRRMKREFHHMQRLTHPGVARVFDLDCDAGTWFMTMELVQGRTLTHWLKTGRSHAEVLGIISGCCEALTYAHAMGIVHGDLKPGNVLVADDGSIKLIDFGSAASAAAGKEDDHDHSFSATPSYASPQILVGGPAEPRDDVFSLACLTYVLSTRGEHPFGGKSSLEARETQLRPAYAGTIQPRLFDVIARGLAWEREERPASVREFLHALLARELTLGAPPPGVTLSVSQGKLAVAGEETHSVAQRLALVRDTQPIEVAAAEQTQDMQEPLMNWLTSDRSAALAQWPALLSPATEPAPAASQQEAGGWPTVLSTVVRGASVAWLPGSRRTIAGIAVLLIAAAAILAARLSPEKAAMVAAPTPILTASKPVDASPAATAATANPVQEEHALPEESGKTEAAPRVAAAPLAPGLISFERPAVNVGAAQTMAVLMVKRLDSTRGRARVALEIESGSAKPGIDYRADASQIIQFVEGQSVRSVFIPLINASPSAAHRPPRSFAVTLRPVAGGPPLGPIASAEITIGGG